LFQEVTVRYWNLSKKQRKKIERKFKHNIFPSSTSSMEWNCLSTDPKKQRTYSVEVVLFLAFSNSKLFKVIHCFPTSLTLGGHGVAWKVVVTSTDKISQSNTESKWIQKLNKGNCLLKMKDQNSKTTQRKGICGSF
jgi:hypothetical protein